MFLTYFVWLLVYAPLIKGPPPIGSCTVGDVQPVQTLSQTNFAYSAYGGHQNFNPLFFFDDPNSCGATSCAVIDTSTGSAASSTHFSASSTGVLTVDTNGGALAPTQVFLRCTHALHSSQDSQPVTVIITGTCADATTISQQLGLSPNHELNSTILDATSITSTYAIWFMNSMDSSNTACPISSYNFYSDSGYTTLINSHDSSSTFFRIPISSSTPIILRYTLSGGDYSFWWTTVFADGSEKQIDYQGTQQFTIDSSACSPSITEGSYASSYSNLQQVQSNDADSSQLTYFVLPTYTLSCAGGLTMTITSEVSEVANPVETSLGSGVYKVVPVSIGTNQEIQIVVKVALSDGTEATFGAISAENYKLQVGCSSAWVTMTASPSLVTTISYNYSPNHDYVYSYINPTAVPSYCGLIFTNAITDITPSGPSISVSNRVFVHFKTDTSSSTWSNAQGYAQSKGMRLLTSAEAIAALGGAAFYPGETVWAAITHNSNADWIHLGDSGQSPGDIWSVCCSSQDSTWQNGSPTTGSDWKAFHEKRGAILIGAYSTDNTIIKFDQSTLTSAFTFKIQSTDSLGITYDSVDITFNTLSCDSASGILAYTGIQEQTVISNIYDNTVATSDCGSQTCRANLNSGNAPYFPMQTYSSPQSNCNNLLIECFSSTGISLDSRLEQITLADGTQTCSPKASLGRDVMPYEYRFRIKITEQVGGFSQWLHNLVGSQYLVLQVKCSTYSNIVVTSWTGSYTGSQMVDKTSPKFYLPTITQSNLNCPITTITTSSDQTTLVSTGMADPTDVSNPIYIQPTDLTLDNLYSFYVLIQTTGSSTYYATSQYQLSVGCGPSNLATILEPSQTFTQTAQVTQFSTSTPTYLEYTDFTNPSPCQITLRTTNPISNANDLSSHQLVGSKYHIINSQPQLKRTAILTWTAQFNGQSTLTKVSSQYTLDLKCGSTSTTITPPSILGVSSDGYYKIDMSASQNLEYPFTQAFSNSNDECPISSITIVPMTGDTSSDFTSSDGISQVSISQQSPSVLLQIPTFTESTRIFKLKLFAVAVGSTTFGTASAYTDDIKIRVVGNCLYESVQVNESFSPIDITFEQDSITSYSADLSPAFYSNEASCPVSSYSVTEVVNIQTSTQFDTQQKEQLAQITNTGQFTLAQFSSVLQNHSITIQGCNGKGICSFKNLLYLTIMAKAVELPFSVETDPAEEEEVQVAEEETIQQTVEEEIESDGSFSLLVPDAASSYEIISGLDSSIMTFDSETGQIQVSGLSEDNAGLYTIEVQVKNLETSSTQTLSIDLTLKYKNEQLQDENQQDSGSEILKTIDFSFMKGATQDTQQKKEIKQQTIEIEKEREKVYLNVTEISPNGQITISFSEQLRALENLGSLNISTLNLLKDKILANVTFICNTPEEYQDFKPTLTDWEVLEFTTFHLILKFNFTNKLYISIEEEDIIDLHFLETSLFRAYSENVILESGYSLLDIRLPKQSKSESDFKNIQNIGNSAKGSMLLTLIVPLCFTLFMSVSMDRVWGLYNMLQIECNLLNFHFMKMPANTQYLLSVLKGISEFSVMSEPLVKEFLRSYIFKNAQWIQEFVFGQGVFVQLGCAITAAALFVKLGLVISQRIYRLRPFFERLKTKLMWSSVFRSQIQTFYPTFLRLLLFFDLLIEKEGLSMDNLQQFITSMVQLVFNMSLPIFSYIYLSRNFENLNKPKFQQKYGTLYQNLNLAQRQACVYTSLFCFKRILFAVSTCYLPNTVIANIYTYIYISIATIGYIINHRPMSSKTLNGIEIFNEYFIVATGYFMLHFTDWIPDINFVYQIGNVFTYLVIAIIGVNFALISFEMFKELKKVYLKRKSDQAWQKYYAEKEMCIDLLLKQLEVNKKKDKNTDLWQREILEQLTIKEMHQNMGSIDEILNDIRQQTENDCLYVMTVEQKLEYVISLRAKHANLTKDQQQDPQDQKVIELSRRVWLDQEEEVKQQSVSPPNEAEEEHNMAREDINENEDETDEHQKKFEQLIIQKQQQPMNIRQPYIKPKLKMAPKISSKKIRPNIHHLEEEKTPNGPYRTPSLKHIQKNHEIKMRKINQTFDQFISQTPTFAEKYQS